MGVGLGVAFLAGGGPPGAAPIGWDVKLPLYRDRAVSISHMADCPSDLAPRCGDHSRSVSTVNAESAPVVRQIPLSRKCAGFHTAFRAKPACPQELGSCSSPGSRTRNIAASHETPTTCVVLRGPALPEAKPARLPGPAFLLNVGAAKTGGLAPCFPRYRVDTQNCPNATYFQAGGTFQRQALAGYRGHVCSPVIKERGS